MRGFFYNSAIKNYLNVVSKLFSDIYVLRSSGEETFLNKVPVNMVDESKVVKARNKINSHSSQYNIAKIDNIYPKINIKLVDIVPNTLFAVGSTTYINKYGILQHSPVPINQLIEINLQGKSMNDVTMMIEQILPYFRPHFNMTIKEICNGRVIHERDLKLVYQTTSINNDTMGEMKSETIYDWSLIFEMIGYIYPPQISQVEMGNVIETIFMDFKGNMKSIDETPEPPTDDFDSVDIQVKDRDIHNEQEWIEEGMEVNISSTMNKPIPEKDPSEIRK